MTSEVRCNSFETSHYTVLVRRVLDRIKRRRKISLRSSRPRNELYRFAVGPAILLTFLVPSHAATIFAENFDELNTGLAVTSVGAFSAIGGTNVDILPYSSNLCTGPESGNCVDLAGSGGNPQGILQTNSPIVLVPGTNYYLSFDLVGSSRGSTDSATVTLANYSSTFVLASDDVTTGIVSNALITVSTAGAYNLTFTNTSGMSNIGLLLDNVSVTTSATSSPVTTPEPATLVFTMPILLMGLARLKFRRKIPNALEQPSA